MYFSHLKFGTNHENQSVKKWWFCAGNLRNGCCEILAFLTFVAYVQ